MRVGIDASNLRQGGGRTHLVEILRAAEPCRDQFDHVVVWGSRSTLNLIEPRSWLELVDVPMLSGGLLSRTAWQLFSRGDAARSKFCDVLFVPGASITSSFRPVVTMSRNMLPFEWAEIRRYGCSKISVKLMLLRLAQTWSFREADGVIFLTEYARARVLSVTGDLRGLTAIIPHGLNRRFLRSGEEVLSRSSFVDCKKIRLLYVSIVDQYKHQWVVVEAVSKARQNTGLDLQLHLVGPAYPPAMRKLESAIAAFDKERAWVHYQGAVDYNDVHSLYAQANVGIFASSCENMPNVLIETMASGLPVLCSNRGPMPEIMGTAGLYFDPENPDSLRDKLIFLLRAEEEMPRLCLAANEKAKAYSWSRCAEQTFAFLRQTLERASRSASP